MPSSEHAEKKRRKTAASKAANSPIPNAFPVNNPPIGNPIERNRDIVAKINTINPMQKPASNKMYGGYLTNSLAASHKSVDYFSIIRDIKLSLQGKNTLNDLLNVLNTILNPTKSHTLYGWSLSHIRFLSIVGIQGSSSK